METIQGKEKHGLEYLGLTNLGTIYWNPSTPFLYEQAIRRREGYLAHHGPLVVRTGHYTGRSPNDRFIVDDSYSHDKVDWGPDNVPFPQDKFEMLFRRLQAYVQGRDLFVQDVHSGADMDYRLPVRVINEFAWQNLFARNLFRQPHDPGHRHDAAFTVLGMPNFKAIPEFDGTNSEAFVVLSFERKLVLIGGTAYAGEMKKSMFSAMNLILPGEDVLPMHCSANVGPNGDCALFFGLSGTGKTTLSADQSRQLIGDDEHGWSPNGVFNFEGGCYAKVIKLSHEAEPEIHETTRRFGTILENVGFDIDTRRVDLYDGSLTENTRAAYPLGHIPNVKEDSMGPHPKNVIFLTADAFGVLPPISKLTPEQAMYHFMSGYTAKLAGTERGVTEPKATFSACFGSPFMTLSPTVYAELLGKKLHEQKSNVWLVNTGWTGGPFGVGHRMEIKYTRIMVNAALDGKLDNVPTRQEKIFGLHIPESVPGVPAKVLDPKMTWDDKGAYDIKAGELAELFHKNFKAFAAKSTPEVIDAGPLHGR
ncbi:MAG: phosphoenolpyruvate carboxykinase (ATP) [Candidatus Electryonea clarkiae]|nr:phosphoenolpyruvate carboxykinase (ATP) [Candidatus Electryonea clarkiae]MDP8288240.1 phosphoenolpyruvate carboxykinase (ATP) [Candidatus Electryonea clarkiae]